MARYASVVLLLLALAGVSCGNKSDTPRIVMVIDALDQNLANVTTGIIPTQFVVQTNAMMSLTSAQAPGSITLTCGALPAAQLTVARDIANTLLAVTVADAWKYARMNCTLTFNTSLTTNDGTPLAEPVSYSFTNTCAVNDDFNADSSGCWDPYLGDPLAEVTWPDLASWLSIVPATSTLDADFTSVSDETRVSLHKIAGVSADGYELEIKIENPSGIVHPRSGPGAWPSVLVLILGDNATIGDIENEIIVGMFTGPGDNMYCMTVAYTVPSTPVAVYGAECNDPTKTYYIKFSTLNGTVTRQYKVEGADYIDLPRLDGTWPTGPAWEFAGDGNRSLELFFEAFGTESAKIGHVKTQGITASGQY